MQGCEQRIADDVSRADDVAHLEKDELQDGGGVQQPVVPRNPTTIQPIGQ